MSTEQLQELMIEQQRLSKAITASIEVIMPDMAQKYLQKNLRVKTVKNRKVNAKAVNLYVNDILNGRWKIGAPIIIDSNDVMIDGQTRCTAVIKANHPIISLVLRGVDPEIFNSLDIGKKRTAKDVLSCLVVNGTQLTKAVGVSSGIAVMYNVSKNYKNIDKNRVLTNPELCDIVKNDFDYFNEPFLSGKIANWRKAIKNAIAENILTGFYYANKKTHGSAVDKFLTLITSNLTTTPSIVREFRDMMITNKGKSSDERGYLSPIKVYRLIEVLFRYSQDGKGLENRKHISKIDLQLINE